MWKRILLILIVTVIMIVTGCTTRSDSAGVPETEFGRMLGYVPYSFLEEYPILFGDRSKLKEMFPEVKTFEDVTSLPEEKRQAFIEAWNEISYVFPIWANNPELASLVGLDGFALDRIINIGDIEPRYSSIMEGNFNVELIAAKLTDQGYSEVEYGQHEYYAIRGDLETDPMNPLGREFMARFNRVAVLDDTLITSPMTDIVTGVFDAMDDNTPSIIYNPACQALADSLGDVLMGVISLPDTLIYTTPNVGGMPYFDFDIPADWGQLQGYDMAALGYRAEGDDRYFDIALYYDDSQAAESDGELIITRMRSYILGTWHVNLENMPFTDLYEPGEPVVSSHPEGADLKISCRLIPEGRRNVFMLIGGEGMPFRDLLFLAPDPSPYIGKNEEKVTIIPQ